MYYAKLCHVGSTNHIGTTMSLHVHVYDVHKYIYMYIMHTKQQGKLHGTCTYLILVVVGRPYIAIKGTKCSSALFMLTEYPARLARMLHVHPYI